MAWGNRATEGMKIAIDEPNSKDDAWRVGTKMRDALGVENFKLRHGHVPSDASS